MLKTCYTKFDGFYVESILFTALGTLWLWWGKREIYELQKLPSAAWIVERKKAVVLNDEKLLDNEHTIRTIL